MPDKKQKKEISFLVRFAQFPIMYSGGPRYSTGTKVNYAFSVYVRHLNGIFFVVHP